MIAEVSVMSPDPPSLMAIARLAWLPADTTTISPDTTGLGMAWLSTPLHFHSSLPVAGSYETTVSAPLTTSSVLLAILTRTGVAQLAWLLRPTRQASLPVFLSRAVMYEPSPTSKSQVTMTRFSNSTGEEPGPMPSWGTPPR